MTPPSEMEEELRPARKCSSLSSTLYYCPSHPGIRNILFILSLLFASRKGRKMSLASRARTRLWLWSRGSHSRPILISSENFLILFPPTALNIKKGGSRYHNSSTAGARTFSSDCALAPDECPPFSGPPSGIYTMKAASICLPDTVMGPPLLHWHNTTTSHIWASENHITSSLRYLGPGIHAVGLVTC